MEKLTIEMVTEKEFTAIDCVKYYKPDITDREADYIIWEETCYPFSIEIFLEQLYQFIKSNNL